MKNVCRTSSMYEKSSIYVPELVTRSREIEAGIISVSPKLSRFIYGGFGPTVRSHLQYVSQLFTIKIDKTGYLL